MCVIPFLVCRHSKHSIDDGMLVGDRPIDTKVATGVWGPHHVKCSKRMIHIPRQKLKSIRFRLEINVVVLRSTKKTVEITYHHVAGHESQELIYIEIVYVSFFKLIKVRLVNEPCELHNPFLLFLCGLCFWDESNLVLVPIVTEVAKQPKRTRLHQQPLRRAVVAFQKPFVLLLNHGEKANRLTLRLTGNR